MSAHDEKDPQRDVELVRRSLEGDRAALAELIARHQAFVYNIALKMFGDPFDAEDLTQEVMIRSITSLRTFKGDSAFRTWLYRIAVNRFLNTRRRGMERAVESFETYFDAIAAVPDEAMSEQEQQVGGQTIAELRVRCTTGMLMCLDRPQRLTFILGALFGVSHDVGGELLGVSPGNFRVRLHRARSDLFAWMNQRCGLVDEANPCRCYKKTKGYIAQGLVDPERLVFHRDYSGRIRDLVAEGAGGAMDEVDTLHVEIFRNHPRRAGDPNLLQAILGNPTLRDFFSLDDGLA
jgi:RNA polymerase sigma factor (sigma-70 family)